MSEEPEKPACSRPSGCENCKKECTIHYTQIINGEIQKVDMCDTCPKAKQMQSPVEFGLMEQLMGAAAHPESFTQPEIMCQACGYTEAEFKKTGRLGCPYCYDVFIVPRMEILMKIHHDIVHKGKEPGNQHKKEIKTSIDTLKKELKKLVRDENYEGAAKVRDEINLLNKELAAEDMPGGKTVKKKATTKKAVATKKTTKKVTKKPKKKEE